MKKVIKRRKHKDNPYTLYHQNTDYIITFQNPKGNQEKIEVTKELYQAFNQFELNDLKQMNEYDRHIEHKEQIDEFIYQRANHKPLSTEQAVQRKILHEKLYQAINQLPHIQRKRIIKYYLQNKNLAEIANQEHCSARAVKYSIDIALKKLYQMLKDEK